MRSRLFRFAVILIAAGLVIVAGAAGTAYLGLRWSLPDVNGEIAAPGLSAPVIVERDAAGAPTLTGKSRSDLAFALGFLHGQERTFQMDLMRRAAAGEASELVGSAALPLDRDRRRHRFRTRARAVLAALTPEERRLLETYAAGVNKGFEELAASPFEYWILRAPIKSWLPEDTILVAYAMYFDLQEETGWTERRRALAFDTLGPALARFLYPDGTIWDAPLDGSAAPVPPIPGPDEIPSRPAQRPLDSITPQIAPGSNAWAVSGRLTASGGAMIANDMHLGLGVPNIWYRARLVVEGSEPLDATGVTLPGVPTVLAGSNGRIAWGFTNSYADTGDLMILEPVDGDSGKYQTPQGPRDLTLFEERICAHGGKCETLNVEEAEWGPVIGTDSRGRKLALRWVAHETQAVGLSALLDLERAQTTQEALDAARRAGVPAQNIVVGDRQGHIGWTLAGPIPLRVGYDGRLPILSTDAARGWNGIVPPAKIPAHFDPAEGRIWTANQRLVGGEALATLGFGGYAHGGRAAQIREGLRIRQSFVELDMLAIQLDAGTPVFERWHALMRAHAEQRSDDPRLARILEALAAPSNRAEIDSVGYRLVRAFRLEVTRELYGALTFAMRTAGLDPRDSERLVPPEGEDVAFRLLTERPAHLLPRGFGTWDALIAASLDRIAARAEEETGGDLSLFTWGAKNQSAIRHPLSAAIPTLSTFLDPPQRPLAGDLWSPRVAGPRLGASERFAVTPGREKAGYFHMPGGQSGHPLSPYYLAGHEDWAIGRATPFLPGPTVNRLILTPS